jgi:hypothetical protein
MTAATVSNRVMSPMLGVRFDLTHTEPQFTVGTRARSPDAEYAYVHASGAITAGDAVAIDEDWEAAALTKSLADVDHTIGFAQIAFADNDYGWVALNGRSINCRLASACAADVSLFTTGTAGVLDDISTSQTKIGGVRSVTTITNGAASEIIANYPRKWDGSDA